MREIKFRAWDNRYKRMVTFDKGYRLQLQMDAQGNTSWCVDDVSLKVRTMSSWDGEGHILMQFTGLKDKNGKEIFEGDIVDAEGETNIVKWDDRFCAFVLRYQNGELNHFFHQRPVDNLRIIGNIYESPELLGKGGVE